MVFIREKNFIFKATVTKSGISIFKEGALMDVFSLVRDLEKAIPPIDIYQDLDETYERPYCRKITLQDSKLNITSSKAPPPSTQVLTSLTIVEAWQKNIPCKISGLRDGGNLC